MDKPGLVTFTVHRDGFSVLGIENIVTETADFGYFWDNFFKLGGYGKIEPYAIDPKPINVWYTNGAGEKIYLQGLIAGGVDQIPGGYSLKSFPESNFLVITHDWLETAEEAIKYGIAAGWKHEKTAEIPEGYVRNDGPGSPITIIEKENMGTKDGSRYEFWVPIKKRD